MILLQGLGRENTVHDVNLLYLDFRATTDIPLLCDTHSHLTLYMYILYLMIKNILISQ